MLIRRDLAAGGLDILNVYHNILFDFPVDICAFIHQVGCRACLGKQGLVTYL